MNFVIIEDSFEDFKRVRTILGAQHQCYPDVGSDSTKFETYLQIFRNCINPDLTAEEKTQAKATALATIKEFNDGNIDAFIIDFELISGQYRQQTGLNFHEFLCANGINTPSLLLTHVDGGEETNKILGHFRKINGRPVETLLFDYQRKNFGDNGFEDFIRNFANGNTTTFDADFTELRLRFVQAGLTNQTVVDEFENIVIQINNNSIAKNSTTYAEIKEMLEGEINDKTIHEFCNKVKIQ